MAELVAGNPQDHQPLGSVLVVELVHLGVIPGGRASEGCDVLNENNFTLEAGEAERLSGDKVGGQLVEITAGHCFSICCDLFACPSSLKSR